MAQSLFASPLERRVAPLLLAALLVGCSQAPSRPSTASTPSHRVTPSQGWFSLPQETHVEEMVIFALGLLDTGYRFGGKNPDAGLDCSGMVSYVVEQVSGKRLPYNAAGIAERTRPISTRAIRPGDLVFFNTLGRPYSHMGIYVGDGKFVHAPNSRGKVRVDRLDNRYYADRFEGAHTLLPEG